MATYNYSSNVVVVRMMMMMMMMICVSYVVYAQKSSDVPLAEGLSWSFYDKSCPDVESMIRTQLKKVFKQDIGLAAALLRLHFHDCFVQGCDGSVLLDRSASGPSEKNSPPDLSLRAKGFEIINNLRARVHKKCGRIVSCSDITAIAARDSVFLPSRRAGVACSG